MSAAMPERVIVEVSDGALYAWYDEGQCEDAEKIYVPASRLAALEAERDALVPLARLGLFTLDVLIPGRDGHIWNTIDFDGGDVELAARELDVFEDVPLDPIKGEWPKTFAETEATKRARALLAARKGEG